MSCLPEQALFLYADGELDAAERHDVESHLVACRECRARVVALRDEELLLRDVIGERERAPRPEPVTPPDPAAVPTGIAWGLPIAIAAVAGIFSAAGFLLEHRMPGSLDLLNPLRLKGAIEMSFDMVFWLRDRAPGLIELAISIAVVASISAVLSLATNALYRRVFGTTVLLLALVPTPGAEAVVIKLDQDTRISSDEIIEESMLLSGDIVHIDGVVRGDVFVAAERVTIGGTIEGSIYVFARDLEITGTVTGSTHGIVEHVRIDGQLQRNLYAMSESVTLAADAVLERDLVGYAEDCILSGKIGRDIYFAGEDLELRGEVGRNIVVRYAERVALRDAARIGGDLTLTIEEESDLDRAPGAQIAGTLDVREPDHMKRHLAFYRNPTLWALHGILLIAAFFFGLLLYVLAPRLFVFQLETSRQFFQKLGFGFLAVVATPVAIVLMALTLVGIPIAILTLFVFLVGIYTANILIGAWLGQRLLPPREGNLWGFARSFFVGLLLLTLITHIPFLGAPIEVIVVLVGVGLIVEQTRTRIAQLA